MSRDKPESDNKRELAEIEAARRELAEVAKLKRGAEVKLSGPYAIVSCFPNIYGAKP